MFQKDNMFLSIKNNSSCLVLFFIFMFMFIIFLNFFYYLLNFKLLKNYKL